MMGKKSTSIKTTKTAKTRKKNLVFITHAPQGTLGDPSSALKLIEAMKKKYGESLNVHLIVNVKPEYLPKVKGIVPKNVRFTPIQLSSLERNFTQKENPKLNELLRRSDSIILYPTPHHFTAEQLGEIKAFGKCVVAATEYDIDIIRNKEGLLLLRGINYIGTGLGNNIRGKKNVGLFLTDENTQKKSHWISSIDDPKDVKLRNFILKIDETQAPHQDLPEREESYFNSHDLYFGYYNNLDSQYSNSLVGPYEFIETCILKSIKKNAGSVPKVIDIIAPVSMNPKGLSTITNIDEIIKEILLNFDNVTVEYYRKDDAGELKCVKKEGAGELTLRIINGFPIAQTTMNYLMKGSDPLCMVTGDQSISEAISNEKIFLYQIMDWKHAFFKELVKTAENYFGAESKLSQFLTLQVKSTSIESKKQKNISLQQLVLNYEEELKVEIAKFHQILLQDHNLNVNLPSEIMKLISLHKKHLRQDIENIRANSTPSVKAEPRRHAPRAKKPRMILGKNLSVNIVPDTSKAAEIKVELDETQKSKPSTKNK